MNLLHLLPILALASCAEAPGPNTLADLQRHAADPANGLVKSRTINGITMTARLVPAEIWALREHESATDSCTSDLGAAMARHRQQLCFVLNLATDSEHRHGDVMYTGVRSMQEFSAQARDLNFSWQEQAELRCGANTYPAALGLLENTYSLTSDRNVVLVFAPEMADDDEFYRSTDLSLVIDDIWLGTGKQRFRFKRADLERAAHLNS